MCADGFCQDLGHRGLRATGQGNEAKIIPWPYQLLSIVHLELLEHHRATHKHAEKEEIVGVDGPMLKGI